MVLFGKTKPLVSFLTAKCPNCGCTALVRTWTVAESRYDGKREEAVPIGGHYVCDDCNAHCRVTATGVARIGVGVTRAGANTESSGAVPAGLTPTAPPTPNPIPVRFPKS